MKTIRCSHCNSETPIVQNQPTVCLLCGHCLDVSTPIHLSGSEFCPRCGHPLETATDSSRLCEVCGWFGDQQEILSLPPRQEDFNAVLAVLQGLELFRDVCRKEQIIESHYDVGHINDRDFQRIRVCVRDARQSLVTLFTALRRRIPQILSEVNGFIMWPDGWTDRHFNVCNEPCDMLIGQCSCGTYHSEKEGWVQSTLQRHDAIIIHS